MFNNVITTEVVINVLLICAILVIIYVLNRMELIKTLEKKDEESKVNYYKLFETLIENNSQPTLLIDENKTVKIVNVAARSILKKILVEQSLSDDYDFIIRFIDSKNTHAQKEILIENNYFYVNMSKFKTEVMNGIFVTFTNVSSIKEAKELQTTFIQNASHELKTPIAAIQGICELFLDNKIQDEQKKYDFISLISKENERLRKIVVNLTKTVVVEPFYVEFDIDNIFKELELLFMNYRADSEDKKDKIKLVFDNKVDFMVRQDTNLLMQILVNLVSNAYKYTDKGFINVSAHIDKSNIVFKVKDTGIGIDQTDLNKIFKRFYRVEKSRSRKTGGSGLGLSIVNELVVILGGSIEVSSKLNCGSEFTVILKDMNNEYR